MTVKDTNPRLRLVPSVFVVALLLLLPFPPLASSSVNSGGWTQYGPLPGIADATFVDASTGWLVGLDGAIWKTSDGGASWIRQDSGVTATLNAVDFYDSQTGWAVGPRGLVLKTTDGGVTWIKQDTGSANDFSDVDFSDPQHGCIVGFWGPVAVTKDGGVTWRLAPSPERLNAVSFVDAEAGWAVGSHGIYKTADGGETWTQQHWEDGRWLEDVVFVDGLSGWVVGNGGIVLRTTDGGDVWSAAAIASWDLRAVDFVDTQRGYAVGAYGTVMRTTDGGTSWIAQDSGTGSGLTAVSFVDAQIGWAVVSPDGLLKTTDGGGSWARAEGTTKAPLTDVDFVDARSGWAVGLAGSILASQDGGATWTGQDSGVNTHLSSVTFVDSQTGWAVGFDGVILKTVDGGTRWVPQRSGTYDWLHGVTFVDDRTGWAVGHDALTRTTDGGVTWTATPYLPRTGSRAITFIDRKNGWVVGHDGYSGIALRSVDGGVTWVSHDPGVTQPLNAIHFVDLSTGWAVGEKGTIIKTVDGGVSWTAQRSDTVQNLMSVHFADSQTGFAVGHGGTILKTSNGGVSWNSQPALGAEFFRSVDVLDALTASIVGFDGTVLRTRNGGGSVRRFEESDSRLIYVGDWVRALRNTHSGGAIARLGGEGFVSLEFNGTSVAIRATKAIDGGIARVALDGGPPEEVDLFSFWDSFREKVWSRSGLSNTRHSLRIEWTGSARPDSRGTVVNVDAIDIDGDLLQQENPTLRFEQGDPKFVFIGLWGLVSEAAHSGGSVSRIASVGSATAYFTGTRIVVVAARGPGFGKAEITLDGGEPVEVDLYDPVLRHQQQVQFYAGLAEGKHTLRVGWLGQKNVASTSTAINLDALDVQGTLDLPPPPTRYEESDGRLAYQGNWTATPVAGASGGRYVTAGTAGSAVNVAFSGTAVTWVAPKGTGFGRARVTLDALAPITVDLYSATSVQQENIWAKSGLSDGPHTLRIEWTGGKNYYAKGTAIAIDAIDVKGTLTPAVLPLTRYEQTDTHLGFQGTWSTLLSTAHSGGSLKTVNATGAAVTVTFKGTSLDWIAATGPGYGKARLTLDGGAPVTVDLYSAGVLYKQPAWSSGSLADGPHTLTIAWTGQKTGTGTTINVDALDVRGTLTQAPRLRRFEQTDTRLVWAGAWASLSSTLHSGGSMRRTNAGGAGATVSFTGTNIAWIAAKGPLYGRAKVTLDGGTPVTVDLYGASATYKQTAWSSGVLSNGPHTLNIEWTGTKGTAASGTAIALDAVDVVGTLN